MGGEIDVTSEQGRVSTFRFTVRLGLTPDTAAVSGPQTALDSTHDAPPPTATMTSPPAPVETGRARLLLVEDNSMNQRVVTLTRWLEA